MKNFDRRQIINEDEPTKQLEFISENMQNLDKRQIINEGEPTKRCYLPARFVLTFLIFWAMCLEFAHRVCLSVTIVVMVNHTALDPPNETSLDDLSCPNPLSINETDPKQQGEYIWTPSTQGVILGAYFYGFVTTQMLGGRLAELAGGKWPLGLSILIGSLLTLLTPIAADVSVTTIVLLRVVMGMVHGICMPTAFAMFAHWAPVEERSTLLALAVIGDHVGTVLSMPLAGYLCQNGFDGGWPSVFYILGLLGCVWFGFWVCFAHNKPADHPRISLGELNYIQKGHIQMGESQKLPVPWKKVLCSMPVWSIVIVTFCAAWGQTTLLTKLPTYLELVLHVPIQKAWRTLMQNNLESRRSADGMEVRENLYRTYNANGLVNSFIYICCCATLFVSGYLSDYLRSKQGLSPTKVRKGFQCIAMFGPALATALIPVVRCQKKKVIALLTLVMSFMGFCGGGHASIAADMAPHHAATIFGLINGLGCTAGIFSPLVAGLILDDAHASIEKWSSVFYVSAMLYMSGGVVFLIWASSEKQSWAYHNENFLVISSEKEVFSPKKQNENGKSYMYGSLS